MSLYFDNEKLFDAEGHLTGEGLYALKDGTLTLEDAPASAENGSAETDAAQTDGTAAEGEATPAAQDAPAAETAPLPLPSDPDAAAEGD